MAEKDFELITVADVNDGEINQDHGRGHVSQRDGSSSGKPQMERYINLLGILNFGFTLQAGWESLGLTLYLVFLNGGPVALVWGCLLAGVGHTMAALSLGEMASIDPTVGAQYRWSARFARKQPEFWGFLQGWITLFAWVVSVAAVLMLLTTTIQGLIGFHDPTYEAKPWHATLMMWALLLFAIFANLFLRRILNVFETISGTCHVLFFAIVIIVLTTLGERTSASYVFTKLTTDISGWKNPGIAFNLGLLSTAIPLGSYDSVLHMIDETQEPRKRVPLAMVSSVVINSIMTWAYGVCLLLCIGDVEKVANSPSPLLEIFYLATGSKAAASVVLLMHFFILLVALFNCVASACRLTWAFARDKGLPFQSFFTRVNPRFQIPLQALAVNSIIAAILGLINLGSTVALQALMSLPATALVLSYFLPILLLVIRKLKGEHPRYGPLRLGSIGLPINLFAMAFCLYCAVWFAWPTLYPISSANMNYSAPIFAGLIIIILIDWFTTGKKRFEVPTGEYAIEMEDYADKKTTSSE